MLQLNFLLVLFLIFNDDPFKSETDGAIRLATLYEVVSFSTMIIQ